MTRDAEPQPGRLLNGAAIASKVAAGEILDARTFAEGNLRGAAYDLRVARDYLITPDGRRFDPATPYGRRGLILEPGDVAFVATVEKVFLPWNIAGNILTKYEITRDGLFVLHGALVDPGYGMTPKGAGWKRKDDERLHFLVTNLGVESCVLTPGESKIAALQLFEIEAVPKKMRKPTSGVIDRWQELAEHPERLTTGLAFFERTTRETTEMRARLELMDRTTERVVVLGIYVLAAALLGMTMAALVALFGNTDKAVEVHLDGLDHLGAGGVLAIAIAVAIGYLLALSIRLIAAAVLGSRTAPRRSATWHVRRQRRGGGRRF